MKNCTNWKIINRNNDFLITLSYRKKKKVAKSAYLSVVRSFLLLVQLYSRMTCLIKLRCRKRNTQNESQCNAAEI